MIQIALIGIGAGAAAALLFASVTSGSLLSVLLLYLVPLPIMIAGLGWSHWAGLIAVAFAASALGLVFGSTLLLSFVASAGLPAWWLSYLTTLSRPVSADSGSPGSPALEWYPAGRLVVWAAVIAASLVLLGILTLTWEANSVREGLATFFGRLFQIDRPDMALRLPTGVNPQQFAEFLSTIMPPAAAAAVTMTTLINLWIAARSVAFSGRLVRPWPQLSAMTLPPTTAIALAVAMAVSFVDGVVGIAAGVLAAGLSMAYAVLGFAVLHEITRRLNGRSFLLGGIYAAALLLQGWPLLVIALIGLTETMFGLRARIAQRGGPPATT